MVYTEIEMDLFSKENDAELLHCISSDFALGAGIAKQFAVRGIKEELQAMYPPNRWSNQGYALKTGHVWNLVTKEKYFHKPTYRTIEEALKDCLRQLLIEMSKDIRPTIALPKIGCGLDRLEWEKVRSIIQRVFADTDFTICVCIYP